MAFTLVMLCLTWAPAKADTLCRKKTGTLKLRPGSVCKKREAVVDPSSFGAVGPTGATGAPGAAQLPGPVGGDLAGVSPNLYLRPNVVTTEAFAELPAARAKATVVQSVPNATPVAVILDDEELDQPGTIFGGNALNTSTSDAGYAYLALHWLGP
jgi:hypothetical protein